MYIYRHKLLHVSNVPLKIAFDFNVYRVYIALIEPSVASMLLSGGIFSGTLSYKSIDLQAESS